LKGLGGWKQLKNCVVRTYGRGYSSPTENLSKKLSDGWTVKSSTPILNRDGKTEYVEYILEKENKV